MTGAPDVIGLHSAAAQSTMLKSWEAAGDYADAVACIDDMTTIHTDHNLTRVRARLISHRAISDDVLPDDVLRVLEVCGIAKAVVKRFRSTPHHSQAIEAAVYAGMVWGVAANRPVHGGEDCFRAFLLTRLDWVHPCGGVRESASADTPICLCPLTAYLQVILRHTPMEDWAAALADPDPDASPLSLAWAWARRSPWIGARTAGVAVLVTMGRHVHRLMADVPVRAERLRLAAAYDFEDVLINEGCCLALGGAAKACFMSAVKRLQRSPSHFENYRRMLEADNARELLAEVQNAAETLGKEGECYAQLLVEKDGARDRELEDAVVSIRTWAGFILGKAEPPVPKTVLSALNSLATANY